MANNYDHTWGNVLHSTPRIPTVDEVLPFSPFTSIIPFDTEAVPPPLALTGTAPLRILSQEQRAAARAVLQSLDREASSAERAHDRLQRTLADVQRLITAADRPKFKLKTPSSFASSSTASSRYHTLTPARNPLRHLSPFARKVLDGASNGPTQHTSTPSSHKADAINRRGSATAFPGTFAPQINPSQASSYAARSTDQAYPPHVHSLPAQHHNNAAQPPSQRQIFIKNPVLSQEELDQYETIRVAQPSIVNTDTKSVINGFAHSQETSAAADHRQKATGAIERFSTLISDIFEAEIDFESGEEQAKQFFTTADTSDGALTILQPEIQFRLDKTTTSLSRFKAVSSIPVDDLSRVQKLCSITIRASLDKYLGIGSGWDNEDVQEWIDKLGLADQAFVAARTILRVMNSGIEEKQLFSEEILTTLLDFVKHTVDSCVITTVEMRPSGEGDDAFKIAHRHKEKITRVFGSLTKTINLLGDVIHAVDLDDTVLTSVESLCIALIFVENAPSEANSALGIQIFERVRRAAMDALAKLFDHNPSHRQSIFDDVLTSLERLPVSRQSSRQYSLPDAKSIQLVSALLLRLVQTSAIAVSPGTQTSGMKKESPEDSEEDAENEDDADFDIDFSDNQAKARKKNKRLHRAGDGLELESLIIPAYDKALNHARYVTNFLVSRALTSTKSSGEPYRVLLDIFIDDFINVLGNTDWPAAEMMLRQLLTRFWEITENNKNPVPSKAMALELMGSMLTGITDMRLKATEMVEKAQDDTPLFRRLRKLYAQIESDEATDDDGLSAQGPYRAVLEFLRVRPETDANVSTALGYHITQWAHQVVRPSGRESAEPSEILMPNLGSVLEGLIRNPENFDIDGDGTTASTLEGRLGAIMVTMRLPFCRLFNQIFNKLLTSMSSDQASLRSKSLRSVEDVLTKDPSILDRGGFVLNNIARCMTDSSPLVRDAALGLLASCLNLRQKLDINAYEHILKRTTDSAINVRKRAIKLSKDIYLRNEQTVIRAKTADALIHCVSDPEPSVVELGRQTLEEIWIAPFYGLTKSDTQDARAKTKLAVQVSLIIETVHRNSGILLVLQDILEDMMSPKSKTSANNIAVCKAFVHLMVDAIVDEDALPGKSPKAAIMQALSVFAQARPKLFASAQVQPLLPYLKNLQSGEDLDVYRYAIVILRCTLPQISNLPQNVLLDTQTSLLGNVSKLPGSELKEAASCLWALSSMSKSTDKLVAVTRSAMENLKARSTQNLSDAKIGRQAERLLLLVGHFVSAFDLDTNIEAFRAKFPNSKSSQVVAIATEIVCPLTSPKVPAGIRAIALEAQLCVCHAWPNQYLRSDVGKAIELVLQAQDPALELVLMRAWRDFFVPGSDRRPVDDKQSNGATGIGAERIEKTYVATDRDGASTSLAQRFMSNIIRISLNSTGDLSVMSAQVVTSINKLGLVHPKESASALVALETSPNASIAKLAFEEHNAMFSKHESIFEKETIRAVQQAFEYQRNTIKDVRGFTGSPPSPKLQLFWDVLKNASAKVRKKFLANICGHLDFQHGKLNMTAKMPVHVELTEFCVQNLALFDYTKLDDLQTLVDGLEKVFASTGTAIAHGIEATIVHKGAVEHASQGYASTDPGASSMLNNNGFSHFAPEPSLAAAPRPIDPSILRELAAGAQILTLIWDLRTYLRRVYSLAKSTPAGARGRPLKDPSKAKEVVRAPQRIPNALAMTEKFLRRTAEIIAAMGNESAQRALCVQFQTLMAVDDEVKIKPEAEVGEESFFELQDEIVFGAGSMSGDDESSAGGTPRKGRKRKAGGTPGGTPRKKRAGGRSRSRDRSFGDDDEWG
ncbi:hypothetical protein K461DRAFT_271547 [Myriangium duriaei CBS 260.36]|uniref:Sister chromatid cohesion protein n=1 Tax=Myriangium duriaei CBS 260.36 TaxID=1168546 RepID=A0A9P4IWG3_9PEZI|nr:hypothetical protein K461DRAFT_271547 [Myriangium duriaei CBS 260.36]